MSLAWEHEPAAARPRRPSALPPPPAAWRLQAASRGRVDKKGRRGPAPGFVSGCGTAGRLQRSWPVWEVAYGCPASGNGHSFVLAPQEFPKTRVHRDWRGPWIFPGGVGRGSWEGGVRTESCLLRPLPGGNLEPGRPNVAAGTDSWRLPGDWILPAPPHPAPRILPGSPAPNTSPKHKS